MGVAQMQPGQTADAFLAETDAALDRAKQKGGNTVSE
jgi:PleD family two-component response regulator